MEIEVNHKELKNLGDYTKELSNQFKEYSNEITDITTTLTTILHGTSQIAIANRINSYNQNQIKKLINYTRLMSENILLSSRVYNEEETEFYEKTKREAAKYGEV